MKYIGKRSCQCDIEDDTYLGSGTILRKAIDKVGEQYFEKEILCVCKTEKEAWDKEVEMIRKFDAVNSKEYYNVAHGGPSRKDGFIVGEKEKRKMGYLNDFFKNEEYYGEKILEREPNETGKPRIVLARTDAKTGWFTTTISHDIEYDEDTKEEKNVTTMVNRYQEYQYKFNPLGWFKGKGGYTLIPKEEYYNAMHELTDWENFDKNLDKFYKLKDKLKDATVNIVNKDYIQTKDIDSKKTKIDYITDLAKASPDYKNLLDLTKKYNDIDFVAVYHAITGRGSISGDSFKDGKFKCTKADVRRASKILDFESQFTSTLRMVKGRRDYMYIVLGMCYGCKNIDNDELLKRFQKYYNKIKSITSIDQTIDDIEYIYNYKKNELKKISIKQELKRNRKIKGR